MTSTSWRADVETVLGWTKADERFLDRTTQRLGDDVRRALAAVVDTRGDPRALAQRLGPELLEKLRGRVAAARLPRTPADAWDTLKLPLEATWSPPAASSPEDLARLFLQRYAVNLESLTKEAAATATAARSFAKMLEAAGDSKKLLQSLNELQAQLDELRSAAAACAHPEERDDWAGHAAEVTHESVEVIETVRRAVERARAMGARSKELARSLGEWLELPPHDRAARAEGMAVRLRAAVNVATSMREELLGPIFAAE